MRPGSVIVDVAIDQGGCVETIHATTHENPTYVVDGVIHYGVANMPGGVPRTSTLALTNATFPYALQLANKGWKRALAAQPGAAQGAQHRGRARDVPGCRRGVRDRLRGSGEVRVVGSVPPILCFHKIERRPELGVTRLSPAQFARRVEALARDGWRTLSLDELERCALGLRAVGARELGITFDDAYRGLREAAFPVLQGAGFTAICAVITEYAGRLNRWDVALGGRRFAHLAWRDIERWVGRGITFVSHTATHRRLTALPASEVARECARSREVLGAVLGVPPRALCYPFGSARGRERVIARREGYDMAFVLDARWGGHDGDPAYARVPVDDGRAVRRRPRGD